MHQETVIVGVDCATDPKRTGLARGRRLPSGTVELDAVGLASDGPSAKDRVLEWLDGAAAAVVAMDAPLGWPRSLGDVLASHRAGDPIDVPPDRMFRRHTDEVVREITGRYPLEVGADRIARTAHAALRLLDAVRAGSARPIVVAAGPRERAAWTAIEVYPAGTLRMLGLPASGYKRPPDRSRRAEILDGVAHWMTLDHLRQPMLSNADVLDAALCVLAGADFVAGHCQPPADLALAEREGWVWVRRAVAMPSGGG